MSWLNDVGGRSVTDEEDNEGVVATMADMLNRVCDDYVGSATLTELPVLANEMICFRLCNPSDRFSLRATSRSLLPAVDGSWRDLQKLEIIFADLPPTQLLTTPNDDGNDAASGVGHAESAASGAAATAAVVRQVSTDDDPQNTTVHGEMKDPDTGERGEFKQTVRSAKLMEFVKWVGLRLPSLKLKTNDCDAEGEDFPPISAEDGHPIGAVLSACADATVMPSVVDVSVESRRLLCDRSLLDALIYWAEYRRHAADNKDVPFWRSLTLLPGPEPCMVYGKGKWEKIYVILHSLILQRSALFCTLLSLPLVKALEDANGEPPAEILPLLRNGHGIGEVMFDADDPLQADSLSSLWRKGLKQILVEKLRVVGSRDPEGDSRLFRSLLQKLLDSCESLQTLNIDRMLCFLELRPTVLHYPKTLTKLECDRLGKVSGEVAVIVENCPLLEEIWVNCEFIDNRDIVAVTKLKRLKVLRLQDVRMPLEFTLAVFGVDSPHQLHQIGRDSSPWPMLEEIRVRSDLAPHPLIAALISCCPKLTRFNIRRYDDSAAADTMLDELCRLPRLSQLHWGCFGGAHLFGDRHVDSLIACCPNLQDVYIVAPEMNLLLIPRLLRGCPELRSVDLSIFRLNLTSPDVSAMLSDIAADVGDRERRVVIKGCHFVGVSRELLDAIRVGFPPDVRLCHSDVDDECLHGRRRCWRCRFEDDNSEWHSFVIGRSRHPHATVVFKYYNLD